MDQAGPGWTGETTIIIPGLEQRLVIGLVGYWDITCSAVEPVEVDAYSSCPAGLLAWHMQGDPGSIVFAYFVFKLPITISSTAVVDGLDLYAVTPTSSDVESRSLRELAGPNLIGQALSRVVVMTIAIRWRRPGRGRAIGWQRPMLHLASSIVCYPRPAR